MPSALAAALTSYFRLWNLGPSLVWLVHSALGSLAHPACLYQHSLVWSLARAPAELLLQTPVVRVFLLSPVPSLSSRVLKSCQVFVSLFCPKYFEIEATVRPTINLTCVYF
jgi:hypothetical protein